MAGQMAPLVSRLEKALHSASPEGARPAALLNRLHEPQQPPAGPRAGAAAAWRNRCRRTCSQVSSSGWSAEGQGRCWGPFPPGVQPASGSSRAVQDLRAGAAACRTVCDDSGHLSEGRAGRALRPSGWRARLWVKRLLLALEQASWGPAPPGSSAQRT
ncbi:hypothetical protein PAL_GLEAN10004899 [Pteropus alecto]|uniref:Uncharacterized protein n=1 Tax=Pteropus alecto TaxID=9402 RepID=L5KL73_PTEAL|nr:hypothetical protein PAL_GLEAN10004899 [Pteropus alecto]